VKIKGSLYFQNRKEYNLTMDEFKSLLK